MKKIIWIWAVMLFCTATYAQEQFLPSDKEDSIAELPALPKLTWGVKGGWNYNSLYGKEIDYIFASNKTNYQSGFHAGVFVDNPLSARYGLKHELLFSQKRIGTMLRDTQYGDYKSTLTMTSIDLMPANFTVYTKKIHAYVGPYLSALVAANEKRKDENGRMTKDKTIFGDAHNDESESRYLQKFDFGINIGAEYNISPSISLGARYMHGFTDIFQYANSYTNEDTKTDNIKIYNRGFMLSIGYRFN